MDPRHIVEFRKALPQLVGLAQKAALHSDSWRGFKVGAVAFGVNENGRYKHEMGSNQKMSADGPKQCAEPVAVRCVKTKGYRTIVGIVVVGQHQADTHSGKTSPTLHPCGECRRLLEDMPGMHPGTLVVTVHIDDSKIREEHTFSELLAFHRS